MIIGHYISHLFAQGGAEIYLRRIAAAQDAIGHTVYYFSKYASAEDFNRLALIQVKSDAALYAEAKRLGVELLHLHSEVGLMPPSDLPTVRTLQGHRPYCPSATKFLARTNSPCDRAYSVSGCLWGHVVDRCGSIRPNRLLQSFQETFNEQRILPNLLVLTNSAYLRDQMIAAGYPADQIQTLYLCAAPVSNIVAPPHEGTPRFVFLGRFAPQKGLTWLLKAFAQVSVPAHLDIAGDGNDAARVRSLIDTLGLSDRVTLHGWLDSEAVDQLIQASRALIFPSVWHEPAGVVAYEAMMNARAVIASRVGGISEGVIDETSGLLVEPNDTAGLAAQIERLAIDWALADRLGKAGHQIAVQSFETDRQVDRVMKIYEQVRSKQTHSVQSQTVSVL